MTLWKLSASALLAGVFVVLSTADTRASGPGPVNVGILKSLFRDTPEAVITTLSRPLIAVMEAQTGITGEWKVASDVRSAVEQLESRQLHLAVMHSFEYGWARQINPKLRALVVANRAVADNRHVLVVREDSPAATPAGLKGGKLAIPVMTREPAHLFLDVRCCGRTAPAQFFKEVAIPGDAGEALDDLILRDVDAALVEKVALDAYCKAKPKQVRLLKVLAISEDFPSGVLVYREGHLPDEVLQKFRTGLTTADANPKAQALLRLAKLTGFSLPTPAYEAQVEELLKVYPPPGR